MRIVVDSGSPRDLNHAEIDRHLEILARFIERVEKDVGEPRGLTMILRSAASSPARALIVKAKALARAGISAKLVVAKLDPDEDLHQLFKSL
ncbi:MAG: hypothetical protein WBE01_02700, partial [Methyloceanibacter sp.]